MYVEYYGIGCPTLSFGLNRKCGRMILVISVRVILILAIWIPFRVTIFRLIGISLLSLRLGDGRLLMRQQAFNSAR